MTCSGSVSVIAREGARNFRGRPRFGPSGLTGESIGREVRRGALPGTLMISIKYIVQMRYLTR